MPVLVTLGGRADGDRVILDVRLVGDESTAAWRDVIHSLVARQIGVPTLAVIDGNPGLAGALREQWPTLAMQRCTSHKLRNVEAKAPARLREELAEEYRRMIYADSRAAREVHVIQAEEWSPTKQKREDAESGSICPRRRWIRERMQ